jgi:Flp pilus assembly protein TadG
MWRSGRSLLRNSSGAVAPTIALSLVGLIAAGGVAFDYARLASMHTELQDAADEAALAAVTQLDGTSGATSRAIAAAQSLLVNETRFSNDGGGVTIATGQTSGSGASAVVRVWFYSSKADAEADTNAFLSTASSADTNAKFVKVIVTTRKAYYALTPIARAFTSGDVGAEATAGIGSSICKVPPVMICNPNESGDSSFTVSNYVGKGLRLVSVGNGSGSWSAGNFGYLNTHGGSNGVPGLQEALGWESPPGDCLATTGVDTKPGGNVPATDALNTRFDVYDNGACQAGGSCGPSIDTVKDLVRPGNASGNNACRLHNSGWQEVSSNYYMPDATNALTPITTTPAAMGHPRDMCHAATSSAANYCSGPIGTGAWDRDAYFRTNYGWSSADWKTYTGLGATATRYQVYSWEIAHRGQVIGGVTVLSPRIAEGSGASALTAQNTPVCSAVQTPSYGTGIVPGGSNVDRRRLSVAVVNCSNGDGGSPVNGNSTDVTVKKWIEVFLVEPSLNRGSASAGTQARSGTNSGDVYVEVIGETTAGGGGATAGQVVRRDVPYLVR